MPSSHAHKGLSAQTSAGLMLMQEWVAISATRLSCSGARFIGGLTRRIAVECDVARCGERLRVADALKE